MTLGSRCLSSLPGPWSAPASGSIVQEPSRKLLSPSESIIDTPRCCCVCNLTQLTHSTPYTGPAAFLHKKSLTLSGHCVSQGTTIDAGLDAKKTRDANRAPSRIRRGEMTRSILLMCTILLAGCATDFSGRAGQVSSICPARHTLSCDVSTQTGEIIPSSCSCVRTADINSLLQRSAFSQQRTFRSRNRN